MLLPWLNRTVFSFFALWWAVGIVLLVFDLVPPSMEWANAVFLITAGILAVFYFLTIYSASRAALAAAGVFFLSMGAEAIAVRTGLFFGDYSYLSGFGPKLFGVPLTIGFAWLMVMGTSRVLASPLLFLETKLAVIAYAVFGAAAATVMDLIIDPVAFAVKEYWVWYGGGAYYGIPLSNFRGWFALSFFLHLLLQGLQPKRNAVADGADGLWEQRMVLLYAMVIIMFIIVALASGMLFAPLLTAAAALGIAAVYVRLRREQKRPAANGWRV